MPQVSCLPSRPLLYLLWLVSACPVPVYDPSRPGPFRPIVTKVHWQIDQYQYFGRILSARTRKHARTAPCCTAPSARPPACVHAHLPAARQHASTHAPASPRPRQPARMHMWVCGLARTGVDVAGWAAQGHNYIGHNYAGHKYVGHNHAGHDYVGHNYVGHNYAGHNYVGHSHAGHNYMRSELRRYRSARDPESLDHRRRAITNMLP